MQSLQQFINESNLNILKAYPDYEYYAIQPPTWNDWYKLFDTKDITFDGFDNNIITVNGKMVGQICAGSEYIVFNMSEDDKRHSKYKFEMNPYYKKR